MLMNRKPQRQYALVEKIETSLLLSEHLVGASLNGSALNRELAPIRGVHLADEPSWPGTAVSVSARRLGVRFECDARHTALLRDGRNQVGFEVRLQSSQNSAEGYFRGADLYAHRSNRLTVDLRAFFWMVRFEPA